MRSTTRNRAMLAGAAAIAAVAGALLGAVTNGSAASSARPTSQDPPTISGKAEVGVTLSATTGRWANNPASYAYQWRRCDQNGGSCSSISGATAKEYLLKPVDRENTLRVRVTATNADGSETATSVPTAVVTNAATPPSTTGCARTGTVPVQELAAPERLQIDRQDIQPEPVASSTSSVLVRFRVSACNGKPVQGALVLVATVPYNQFTVPAEVQTGADGYAQLELRRLDGFPAARQQQLLVMMVRARKAGESVLSGISTRRLVSFSVDLRQ
jgi:hypothetical protein